MANERWPHEVALESRDGGWGQRLELEVRELAENPRDGRRLLYVLSPGVPLVKTEKGAVVDFGFCLVRL